MLTAVERQTTVSVTTQEELSLTVSDNGLSTIKQGCLFLLCGH